jgi:4-amino-4-deoxy-L-arabinose transferase-like glycosyltransferase
MNRNKTILSWSLVILLALLARAAVWRSSPILSRDGVGMVYWSELAMTDPHAVLHGEKQEPLYPFLLGLTHRWLQKGISDPVWAWEFAGLVLGALSSLAVMIGTYEIAQSIFDRRVGVMAALLTGLVPELVGLSANVMSEPTFLAFLTLSTAFFLLGLKSETRFAIPWLVLSGFTLVLAFLARKEGLAALPVFLIFALLPRLDRSVKRRLAHALLILASTGTGFGVYHLIGGRFLWIDDYVFALKHHLVAGIFPVLFTVPDPVNPSAVVVARTLRTRWDFLWEPVHHWLKLCPWTVALAVMVCPALFKKHRMRPLIFFLLALIGVFMALIYVHSACRAFFVGRYLLPAVIFALPLAAAVIVRAADTIQETLRRSGLTEKTISIALTLGLAVFLLPSIIPDFLPHRDSALGLKLASQWLKINVPPTENILTYDNRVPFYLGRPCIMYQPNTFIEHFRQDPAYYAKVNVVVFYQYHNEEWIKDAVLKAFREHRKIEPRQIMKFSLPGTCDVLVFRV